MDLEEKVSLVLRDVEEVITESELRELLSTGGGKGYLGYEPSGIFHVGWFVWAFKFKELIEAGLDMYLLAATWHAWVNDKLGGDMELIRFAADHVVEVLNALGMEGRFKLVYAEDLIHQDEYPELLLRSAKVTTLARLRRALTIMGRKADEAESDFSKLIYPLMQVTDIFMLDLDLALGGMDQRRAHVLQRETAEKLGKKKVVALHTPLIPSLKGVGRMDIGKSKDEMLAEAKMSKSRPETTIFVIDSDNEIRDKIRKAYCPPKVVEDNPVLSLAKHLIFRDMEVEFTIDRPAKFGGPLTVWKYEELEKIYREGSLHPLDLKNAVANYLIELVTPIRQKLLSSRKTVETIEEIMKSISR